MLTDPKKGDLVTSELYVGTIGGDKQRVEGKIQVVRPRTERDLPIKVGGFWFNPEELFPMTAALLTTNPNRDIILPC